MVPESLRLWHLCDSMEWTSLPVAGGIYDQHPKLIQEWEVIFSIKAEVEHKRAEQQKREQDRARTAPR